jgi:hypothetical protein
MWVRKDDKRKQKLQLVKVMDKTTALFKDAKGNEFVLTLDQVEPGKPMRRCDARNVG